ncbi:pyridoxal phosphate-dependent aminotransferase [Pectinatus sottacetonis]|uniref:pyridoxal phosphate-dependent aminotransferase n=1 Tax=Pectinatus sottacetonis TaxID=1002795 RepID=UPI0018C829BC|nr:pyridoxal phosphate-dependent aminotransferase [Pectinatus sottacetonis]
MFSENMYELGTKKSTIRTIFEYGRKRAAEVGENNIYDYSLGNPNVPAPNFIKQAIVDILNTEDPCAVHGYTIAPGLPIVREKLAKSVNHRFNTKFSADNFFITGGAAGAITIVFKALSEKNDEFIAFAPFFPEYKCFVESTGAKLVIVPAQPKDFQINFAEFEKSLSANTKAVIVNSPNNPSGTVYSEETIKKLTRILAKKSKEYGHPIFLISDEPYREIVYNGVNVPYLTHYYKDTIICYSYSKSFSLAGERIGYIIIPDEVTVSRKIYGAVAGAARVLTHVNAPSLFQRVIARCCDMPSDISAYEENGRLLYDGLLDAGFKCVKPQGAFYLFPESLEADDYAFCKKAQEFDLLLVPGTDFGCAGHFRASYCIKKETIKKSLPIFKKLADSYKCKG